jgi:hypothetical protein
MILDFSLQLFLPGYEFSRTGLDGNRVMNTTDSSISVGLFMVIYSVSETLASRDTDKISLRNYLFIDSLSASVDVIYFLLSFVLYPGIFAGYEQECY